LDLLAGAATCPAYLNRAKPTEVKNPGLDEQAF